MAPGAGDGDGQSFRFVRWLSQWVPCTGGGFAVPLLCESLVLLGLPLLSQALVLFPFFCSGGPVRPVSLVHVAPQSSVTNIRSFRREYITKILVSPSPITTRFILTYIHIIQSSLIYFAPFSRLAFASVSVGLGHALAQAVAQLVSWLAPCSQADSSEGRVRRAA